MKKIETKKGNLKNTPANKIRRIQKSLITASGKAVELLSERLRLWQSK